MNPRLLTTLLLMLLLESVVFAVSPLVTDDADTVEAGKLQLNCDFQFIRTSSTSLYFVPINPVLGLTPRLELGAIFGYQWRDGSGSTPTTSDADDLTDLTIAPKLRLWQGLEDKLKFSARMDLKLPTASERQGSAQEIRTSALWESRLTTSGRRAWTLTPDITRSTSPARTSTMIAGLLARRSGRCEREMDPVRGSFCLSTEYAGRWSCQLVF